jgi:pyruvate dehydrogenase (quinone)
LGFVELEMKANGFLDNGVELHNPNFAAMAEGAGVKGLRVEDPAELPAALEAAFTHAGPVVIDAVTARQELVLPPKTTLEQAYRFNLFMIKAVLDGRATELVDLARTNLLR